MTEPFVAIEDQCFASFNDWVNNASSVLTSHPLYFNAEHDGPANGWRGAHFTALCFDQRGNRVRNGSDFMTAVFPVWWVWPDQIAALIMRNAIAKADGP